MLIVAAVVLGCGTLLNQFGPLIASLSAPYLSLDPLSPVWEVNTRLSVLSLDYSSTLLAILIMATATALAAPHRNGALTALLQGFGTGLLLLPALVLTLALVALLLWLVWQLIRLLDLLIGLILVPIVWVYDTILLPLLRLLAIPFIWVYETILLPVLRFVAIPFVWLWEDILRDVLLFLAAPFAWIWRTIIAPVASFLFQYVAKTFFLAALSITLAGLAILPVAIPGLAMLEALRTAVRSPINSAGLFSQGMTLGALLLDVTVLSTLNRLQIMESPPPISLLVGILIAFLFLPRLLAGQRVLRSAQMHGEYLVNLKGYAVESRCTLVSACVLMPAFTMLAALYGGED